MGKAFRFGVNQMSRSRLNKATKPRRVDLSVWHYFVHFSFSFVIFLTPIYNFVGMINIWMGNYSGRRTFDELLIDSILFLLAGLLFTFWQYSKLKFKEIKIEHTEHDYQHALGKTIADLKWRVDKSRDGYFRAHRVGEGFLPISYWGEMITIIRENDTILINSISDPNQSPTFSSFGSNRKNIRTFIKNLHAILAQKRGTGTERVV